MATIIIPTPLRKFTQNQSRLDISAGTVQEAVAHLSDRYPEIKKHLLEDSGRIRSFLNLFVGEDDIRDLENENTALAPHSVLSIIPAIAGGIDC